MNQNVFALSTEDVVALKYFDSAVTQSQKVKTQIEPMLEENWSNYRVEPFHHHRTELKQLDPYAADSRGGGINQLKSTESHQVSRTLTSVILATIHGVRDYVQADPIGDEDVEGALKVSRLVMYGLERPGGFMTDYETLQDGVNFGLGVGKNSWDTRFRMVPRRLPVPDGNGGFVLDPETGVPLTVMQNITVPVFDDIVRTAPSLWDLWLDTSVTRFSDQKWIIERMRMSRDTLRAMKGEPGWIEAGINRVLAGKPDEWARGPGEDESPKLKIEQLTLDDIKNIKDFGFMGAWEYYGELPSEVARKLGLEPLASSHLIMINGSLVFKGQNTQYRGHIPYTSIDILPSGNSLYNLSPLTVIKYLQDISDSMLILSVQAALEAVYQNYVVGGAAGVGYNFANELKNRKPREVFMVSGDSSQIQPLVKDYTGLSIASQTLSGLSQIMRDASAARDPIQGQASGGRTTATETNIVAQSALQNIDSLAAVIERHNLPELGRQIHDLYRVHLEDEGAVIKRVGDSEATKISFFDIEPDFDIAFVGARHIQSKSAKANDMLTFFQAALSNPITSAQLDFFEFVRRLGDEALDIKGLESLVNTNPEEAIAKLQAMGLARQGPLNVDQGGSNSQQPAAQRRGSPSGS